jgi:hypothetical protein
MLIPKFIACVLSHDPDVDLWEGHCLNFDIVTSAPTRDESWKALKEVVVAHIMTCLTDRFPDGLTKHVADREHWVRFNELCFDDSALTEPIAIEGDNTAKQTTFKGVEVASLPSSVSRPL